MRPELRSFLGGFRSLWGALTVAACAGPLSLQFSAPRFVAPWPDAKLVTGFAVIACAIALVRAYVIYTGIARARTGDLHAKMWRRAAPTLLASSLLLAGYLTTYSFFVISEPQPSANGNEVAHISAIRGFSRLPVVIQRYEAEYPDKTLWSDFQYDEERVWTKGSLTAMRLTAVALYLGFFFSITFSVALLTSGQVAPRVPGKPAGVRES